ncbi:glycosyltransferase [Nonomuraea sp. NPDC050540]|uniref:glycosyltransferase n=1 Tax=Nonomuraea sp. NPDC050540 TaxID=3364367 RepID=UPI0037B947FF
MQVLLTTYGSRGDVEPMLGLAVRLRELGAEVRMCAPPDEEFAKLPAGAGVPLLPLGPAMGTMARPSTAADASRRVSQLAELYDTVIAAAEGCDALVAGGLAHFASRSVAEKLGVPYRYATFCSYLETALNPGTAARAGALAATIRTDGAEVAAKLLLDTLSRERPPVSA